MSRETAQHLNTNVLIGNTDQRGHAWHYRADLQGTEPNHYPGFIPVEDVRRRLFYWHAEERKLAIEVPCDIMVMDHLNAEGQPARWVVLEERKAISRDDDTEGTVMGIFAPGYAMHQYDEWLLTVVANLLDDDLGISSAGLLANSAIAWVEVSVPETITTKEGVTFRPNLLATTSFDGSIATTFKRTITDTVCDNTRAAALAERGETFKVKHSRYSSLKLVEARDALALVHTMADDFAAEVAQLCAVKISPSEWDKFLTAYVPFTDAKTGKPLEGRSKTMADKKRETIAKLYRTDLRVAPWAGTAHGVLQAVNTFEHHEGNIVGKDRAGRNMLMAVKGTWEKQDRDALALLQAITGSQDLVAA